MIALIEGNLIDRGPGYVVVLTGGIGYKVNVSTETSKKLAQKEVRLLTHQVVRDDSLELYGFIDKEELSFFKLLLKVPGIGPKSALGILSVATISVLEKAITANNIGYLTKVSGIGKKTAEKVIFVLKDELVSSPEGQDPESLREESDVIEALKALGYSTAEAREATKKIPEKTIGLNERIKEALRILGGK